MRNSGYSDGKDTRSWIAIVGSALRFPGASTPAEFWANVVGGVESIRTLSEDQLRAVGVPASTFSSPNFVARHGSLSDVDLFDAGLFGFSREEAERLDPQHRILLECSWRALERAGRTPRHVVLRTGVYVGCALSTYSLFNVVGKVRLDDLSATMQAILSSDKDFLATRIAHQLGLTGPAIGVQTACSTSLVAVHLACQALLNCEVDMALAGAAAIQVPERGYLYDEDNILSRDGHCRAFCAEASGTVPGSGAGVVVLRRYDDALNEGDDILAVIIGTAVNNDGGIKVGFTAPSVRGQAEVIALAQEIAGVTPDEVSFVETHGTATALGDMVEVAALREVFGARRASPCVLGSVKASIGHLDAAAGMAGLLKTVLALQARTLPGQPNFTAANPALQLESSPFVLRGAPTPWSGDGLRIAGVSSFGLGGTNAHIVVAEAPYREVMKQERQECLLPLSACSAASLLENIRAWTEWLPAQADAVNVCFTAARSKAGHLHRTYAIGRNGSELAADLAKRGAPPKVLASPSRPVVCFLFDGQGVAVPRLRRDVFDREPTLRSVLERCEAVALSEFQISILKPLLSSDPIPGLGTEILQPALYSLEVAMAELLRSWGIVPTCVAGHSLGEYAAAAFANTYSLEDGLRMVAKRGQLMSQAVAGEMHAVFAPVEELRESLKAYDGLITIAAINGPRNTVLAGDPSALRTLLSSLQRRGLVSKCLPVSHAFHSAAMRPAAATLAKEIEGMTFRAPEIPFVSNLRGRREGSDVASADYWVAQMLSPVLFDTCVRAVAAEGVNAFVEIGPSCSLMDLASEILGPADRLFLHTLEPSGGDAALFGALGELYRHGADICWDAVYRPSEGRVLETPEYPFQRRSYWKQGASPTGETADGGISRMPGARVSIAGMEKKVWNLAISCEAFPFLRGHTLGGVPFAPGGIFVEFVLTAAQSLGWRLPLSIGHMNYRRLLVIPEGTIKTLQLVLSPAGSGRTDFQVFSSEGNGDWALHADGHLTNPSKS